MAVIGLWLSKISTTSPSRWPSGRSMRKALRVCVLIRPSALTVAVSSEYSSTALVVSSCAGRATFASACSQSGASEALTCGPLSSERSVRIARCPHPRARRRSLLRGRGPYQDDLLLILAPHGLKEIIYRVIVLL